MSTRPITIRFDTEPVEAWMGITSKAVQEIGRALAEGIERQMFDLMTGDPPAANGVLQGSLSYREKHAKPVSGIVVTKENS